MRRILLVLCLGPLVAACQQADPWDNPGTWHETNSNENNLRAMVANPHDLVAGQAATGSWGQEAAAPVQRLVDEKVHPLTTVTTSSAQ